MPDTHNLTIAAPQASELAHERLAAYQVSKELDALVVQVCRRMPRGYGWMVDQIQRASTSMVLNLVEAIVPHCPPEYAGYEKSAC
jgi:hypothetical protein